MIPNLDFQEFAALYCGSQEQTPEGLLLVLQGQKEMFVPEGWVLLRCVLLGPSYGFRTIAPFGPRNTLKAPPEVPVSPRGLASDTSILEAILLSENLPEVPGAIPGA